MTEITDPAIDSYSAAHSAAEPPLLTDLARATHEFSDMPQMMVGRLEGRFLKLLVAAIGARRVLEVGTFTGYSALSMAEALPPDGEIVTHDINERHAEMAQRLHRQVALRRPDPHRWLARRARRSSNSNRRLTSPSSTPTSHPTRRTTKRRCALFVRAG